jgi:pimeloyl-ACP methyl ester carboxylesterase
MRPHPLTVPVHVPSGDERLHCLLDLPAADAKPRIPVLICAPWGWEETSSYRIRREWADRLAAAGHPTLRFDFPSVGDSTGVPGDPDRIPAWIAAVTDAAAYLRDRTESSEVAALGLGFGGLIAMAAVDQGAEIDQLALWAAPSRGRRLVREITTFAKMQAWGAGRGEESPLPEGWVEAGGFVLSAETFEALKGLKALDDVPARLRRALILDRDGMELDKELPGRLEAAGVDVTVAPGPGWGDMTVHPEQAVAPEQVFATVGEWLGGSEAVTGATADPSVGAGEPNALEVELPEGRLRETPFFLEQDFGRAFGVLAEPVGERRSEVTLVFLNAGSVRHIGPNRNWVENARRWAARGVSSARIDIEGIGEADGDSAVRPGKNNFYSEEYWPQVSGALDDLQVRGFGSRFVLIGLCSGGYWSLHAADRDPRVRGAILLNTGAMVWHEELRAERQLRLATGTAFSAESWRRLLRLEVNVIEKLRKLSGLALWKARLALRRLWGRLRGRVESVDPGTETELLLDRLRDADKRLAMGFCANEPVLAELQREGVLDQLGRWPNVALTPLVGEDHALGPIGAQRSGEELIDREVERALSELDAVSVS